ncbi:MAG: TIGR00282 family metallophosphoesterase [Pirellulaceae bacterium]|nr:TIGR00282 family metallophosphoesterase [Pirellulaceae bacterium]
MRILFIGDIVGKPGRRIVVQAVNRLREELQLDLVIANAENSADGSGLTPKNFRAIVGSGVDCITMGDHIYRRDAIYEVLENETENRIVKPANYPPTAPGRSWTVVEASNGARVGVFSLLGRTFMRPVDCPFAAADRVLDELPSDVVVRCLDFHAEATSDKQLMGRYLDGRVSVVLGTHTHVPTADEQILPGGTAFQCDLGMTGPYESILGRRIDRITETVTTFRPTKFDVATEDVRLCGAIVDIDDVTGRSTEIRRVGVCESEFSEAAN